MFCIDVRNVSQYKDHEVTIRGWLFHKRRHGGVWFLIVRDGSGMIQAIASKSEISETAFKTCQTIQPESSLSITGKIDADARAPGGYEIRIRDLVMHQNVREYPLQSKSQSISHLMDYRHLWLRDPRQTAILKIRHAVEKACQTFLDQQNFIRIEPPILTQSPFKDKDESFSLDYFGSLSYLNQTGQMYLEAAAMAFGKVYCLSPTFHAIRSKTRSDLTETWMLEVEVAYMNLNDSMALAEQLIQFIIQQVFEKCREEFNVLKRDLRPLENIAFPIQRMRHDDALNILKKADQDLKIENILGIEEAKRLCDIIMEPVLIHRYPDNGHSFFLKVDSGAPKYVLDFKLFVPNGLGAILQGGEREDNEKALMERMHAHPHDLNPYQWYLDLRRFGSAPHAGFGLSIENTVAWICYLKHVRETIAFPRMMHRLSP